ncbi:MAG: rod shape-determining protein MreD [Candidatus Hydrogenedentota bacterium]|nr:MAG: rod shape-determining protein MreD [Candidatus Hydrogenedentota bacterium]
MILERVVILVSIFVSYFLQSSVDFFRLGEIKPDFILILTVYIALYRGDFAGIWVGFLGGLLQDINLGGSALGSSEVRYYIGTHTLPVSLIGYFTGKIAPKINKEGTWILMILLFFLSLAKGFLTFFLVALFHSAMSAQAIVSIIIPEALYNGIFGAFWFKLLQWALPQEEHTSTTPRYIR